MANSIDFTPSELRQETRKLRYNLERRIERIRLNENAAKDAVKDFDDIIKEYGRDIGKLNDKEVKDLYRDLKYTNSLKSSTVKGAIESLENIGPLKDMLKQLPKDTQDKFWDVYKELYRNNPMINRYKYEVLDTLQDKLLERNNIKDSKYIEVLTKRIEDLYMELTEKFEGNTENGYFRLSFSNRLSKL